MVTCCNCGKEAEEADPLALAMRSVLTERQFNVLRSECVGEKVSPELAQLWIMRAIVREDEVSRWYWVSQFSIEEDILECLKAVTEDARSERRYDSLLRHVRRFLLTRYAFQHVLEVNRKLAAHLSGKRAGLGHRFSLGWLWKDLLLPRIALSLFIGYAILLGAGDTRLWLKMAASTLWPGLCIASLLLCLILFLVYLSVRTRIGTADSAALARRTVGITLECLAWAGIAAVIQNSGQRMLFHRHVWTWYAEFLTAEAALFVALLGQFFFGKSGSGSISEPL